MSETKARRVRARGEPNVFLKGMRRAVQTEIGGPNPPPVPKQVSEVNREKIEDGYA